MRKYLLIPLAAIILCGGGAAYASGYVSFPSAAQINFPSGSQININAPTGVIDAYSSHPTISNACTGSRNTKTYGLMKAAGASWQRTDFDWSVIESTSTSDVFTNVDCMLNDAIAAGIQTIAVVKTNPAVAAFAHSGCDVTTQNCAPVDAATFGAFCGRFAAHYAGKLLYFEIGNEINSTNNWRPAPSDAEYTAALNACGTAIKAQIPNAVIIVAGMNSNLSITGTYWRTFTHAMLADGAVFDMFAIHPYTYGATVNDSYYGWCGTGNGVACGTRAELNAVGMSSKQIIVTEYGAPTCDSVQGGVTLQNQVLEAKEMIATTTGSSAAYLNFFPHFFWYTLYDANSDDQSSPENCFGIFTTSGKPKPVYEVVRSQQ